VKIIIVGYGRIGTQVLRLLANKNHNIIVIDKDSHILSAPKQPGVTMVVGDAVDPDLLRQVEAEKADVLMALTREENTNLMVVQIARVAFHIPTVIAMVYDPQRDESFCPLGINTLKITVTGAEILAGQVEALSSPAPAAPRLLPSERRTNGESRYPVPVRPAPPVGAAAYVIIMGGGKVGYYLGRTLLEEGHEITVIESDPEVFAMVSRQLDCPVIRGDGSTHNVLEKAGAGRANVFVAVTNHDHDNLIACEVAKREFGVSKTISRVKNPKNEWIMQQLGVDVTVSSTAIISSLIESELPEHKIRMLLNLRAGNLEIMEYVLDGASPVVGHQLKELTMPSNCNIVTILRQGCAVVPRGDTAFEKQDVVLALAAQPDEANLRKLLLG
jgi:trk/ktr system potassium uptake protein